MGFIRSLMGIEPGMAGLAGMMKESS